MKRPFKKRIVTLLENTNWYSVGWTETAEINSGKNHPRVFESFDEPPVKVNTVKTLSRGSPLNLYFIIMVIPG